MEDYKFYNLPNLQEFVVSKSYEQELREKVAIFKEQTRTRKSVFVTMLSVFGVKKNEHYLSVVSNQLLIDDLFT